MPPKIIYIFYYSKSNNTKLVAKRIMEIGTHYMLENQLKIVFMKAKDMDIDKLIHADALIIGSPDYYDYPSGHIKVFFDEVKEFDREMRKKPIFTFLTYNGAGKGAKYLDGLAESLKMKMIHPCISVKEDNIDKKVEKKIIKALQDMIIDLDIKANF